ncbi:hypothetical protein [Salinarimonas rosea]|uniref:hypothetical protein n=1 Tax=Salinarimonas rosea TaxID=552063 RepID=UPI0004080EFA|nr:hypothetical protein [Salinarimonas rosea]
MTARLVAAGLWLCATVFVSSHLVADWRAKRAAEAAGEPSYFRGVSYEKTRALSVPILREGRIAGYVVAQFVYTVDTEDLRRLRVPPESFILDETFQRLFADETIDFADLRAFDMRGFLAGLTQSVNARLGEEVVRELMVEEFNFVDPAQIRAG